MQSKLVTPEATKNSSKAEARRNEILDAAAHAFMQKGFGPASIDDVSDILGATKGQVYYYYRSKMDLFFDVHLRAMEMDLAAVKEVLPTHEDPVERLRAMAVAHLTVILNNFAYQRVAVQGLEMHMAGQTTEEQRGMIRHLLGLRDEYEKLFSKEIERAIAQGLIPKQDVHLVSKAFFGALNWTTIWYRTDDSQTDADRTKIIDSITTYALRGLGAGIE